MPAVLTGGNWTRVENALCDAVRIQVGEILTFGQIQEVARIFASCHQEACTIAQHVKNVCPKLFCRQPLRMVGMGASDPWIGGVPLLDHKKSFLCHLIAVH